MTKRVAIICEGRTEHVFVRQVLQVAISDVHLVPINLDGGTINTDRLVDEAADLSHQKFDCITTLVDFYQFQDARKRSVEEIEEEMHKQASKAVLRETRFLPYVQKYEFEALLFADKSKIAEQMGWKSSQRKALNAIQDEPENINHDKPPYARILQIGGNDGSSIRYRKTVHGIAIINEIGLDKIRQKCPRFGKWFNELSAIAKQQ